MENNTVFQELDERSRIIFEGIVSGFLETGEPIGSRTLSRMTGLSLSPATIRNVMADLEHFGLLQAPHKSAGRMPSQLGLRFYVDGLMEIGALSDEEQKAIQTECSSQGSSMRELFEKTTSTLSGLTQCAGLVVAPKANKPVRQIQFVPLGENSVLTVIVYTDGMVENRVLEIPEGLPATSLIAASNYLTAQLQGKTLDETRDVILNEINLHKAELDKQSSDLVKKGLAVKTGSDDVHLIVKGQKNLLNDIKAMEELERVREIFSALEEKESMMRILQSTENAQGVQIYIGTENEAFAHEGLSMIVSPYKNVDEKVIGAIGVIGPTRLNYGRLIPMVDYTAKIMAQLLR